MGCLAGESQGGCIRKGALGVDKIRLLLSTPGQYRMRPDKMVYIGPM